MSKVCMLIVTGLLCGMLQEEVDNPSYKHWAKFKVGTYSKLHSVSDVAGNKTESDTTYKLLELTPEAAKVEMNMGAYKTTMEHKAKIKKTEPPKDQKEAAKPKEGDEEIEVAGKKYKCHWVEIETKTAAGTTKGKTWTCGDVPGMMVKSESTTEGQMKMTSRMILTEVHIEK